MESNYVSALGQGSVQPGRHLGGQPFDLEQEARQRMEILETAITAGLISQNDVDNFNLVHDAIDAYIQEDRVSGMGIGNRADALPSILEILVQNGEISQRRSDLFLSVHDQMIEAGLME